MRRYGPPLGVWLALTVCPAPMGLSGPAWSYFALFAAVITALVTEPLPPPAIGLVGVTVAIAMGSVEPKPADSLAWGLAGFSDSTVWLIFAASILARVHEKTGLGRRIALTLVWRLGGNTLGLGYAVALADLLIAPFMPSNTARSAGVIFPILRQIPALYHSEPGPTARRIGGYLMWVGFATTAVTSSLFLTALGPNLLSVGLIRKATGVDISWTVWLLGIWPVGLVLMASLPAVAYLLYPPEIRSSREVPAWAAAELDRMGRVTAGERAAALLTILAFALWILARDRLHATTVGLIVVGLMLVLRLLTWEEIAADRSAWGMLVYFATLITLAEGLVQVGFIAWASRAIAGPLATAPPLVALAVLLTCFFLAHYLFASLTAHTMALLPVVLAAGAAIEGMPIRLLALLAAYSIGLMGVLTPYATGPAPVYFGSGFIPRAHFWALGLVFGLIFLAVLLVIGLPYLLLIGG